MAARRFAFAQASPYITTSAPLPKFVIHRGPLGHELRKQRGTSKSMILVPLFDLKVLKEAALVTPFPTDAALSARQLARHHHSDRPQGRRGGHRRRRPGLDQPDDR